jgi:regulatory protein
MYSIEEFDKEKTKVMNYIMYKKRTEYEVKNKFQNTIQKELLCDIISYIKEAGYLDDSDYVKRTVSEFIALKNLSSREIKYKLYTKGITKEIIEDYFYKNSDEIEEYERKSAQNIVIKKQNIMEKEDIEKYLLKKGYKEQIIKEVLECKNY